MFKNQISNVLVTNPEHPRHGTAGVTAAMQQEGSETVPVTFDLDKVTEDIAVTDLKAL
jgi:hypothetical protein